MLGAVPKADAVVEVFVVAPPPLAGLVTAWWSWRAVFFGLVGLTLLRAMVTVLLLRRTARDEASPETQGTEGPVRRPTLSAAAVSAAAALSQYGVSAWDVRHTVCT